MENINYIPEWAKNAIIYHIYPIGFFGAPKFGRDETAVIERLINIRSYYNHFKELGINVVQFGPIFESVSHGYDTIDYMKIDHRLGTNDSFKQIITELHDMGIKVMVDGVFNHVSREFDSFKDVQIHREESWRKHWHYIDFSKNSPHDDGFDYKNWEGYYSLVKLNLQENDVKNYIFSVAEYWLKEIGIDGWRLDVAYLIGSDFLREFRKACKNAKPDCLLIGEMIHGPYTKWIGPELLDAGTGYQIYKSIWSAINSSNMHELKSVIERSFHQEWGLFKDTTLINFLGNHDSTRIRSILKEDRFLYPALLYLFTTNGIPKIYYGDEIGVLGVKTDTSDDDVRKPMPSSTEEWPSMGKEIFQNTKKFIQIRKNNHALTHGSITPVHADPTTLAFIRRSSQQTILVVINSSLEQVEKTIPLWNQNLNGVRFTEILDQGGDKEYHVENNQ
ncbi:MAG: alpha-amylase, partial [candidate division Zixibacteria bacterium]|nr:alpha-amylase [candidate division Zixibacteria bacterium]